MYEVSWLFDFKVYALTDYDDNIFYIGCTMKPLSKRLIGHLSAAKAWDNWRNSRKDEKIRSLDFKVKIKEVYSFGAFGTDARDATRFAFKIEEEWIKKYLSTGVDLCNCTEPNHRQKGNKKAANE